MNRAFLLIVAGLAMVLVMLGLADGFGTRVAAAPSSSVTREDEITIYAGRNLDVPPSADYESIKTWFVKVDPSRYPSGVLFRLDVMMHLNNSSYCVQIARVSDGAAVSGSEVCFGPAGSDAFVFGSSGSFQLPSGPELYVVETKGTAGGGTNWVDAVRLYAEWTERTR